MSSVGVILNMLCIIVEMYGMIMIVRIILVYSRLMLIGVFWNSILMIGILLMVVVSGF